MKKFILLAFGVLFAVAAFSQDYRWSGLSVRLVCDAEE